MTKRRPPKLHRDPPWMRLGPAGDDDAKCGGAKGADAAPANDGESLWRRIAEGITPLAKTKHRRNARPLAAPSESEATKPSAGGSAVHKRQADREEHHAPAQAKGRGPALPPSPPALVPGKFAGIDRNSSEKFRKGKMAVDAKLDLHGMTQNQAHSAVTRFVAGQQAAGARCVLIVTGKGKAGDPFAPKSAPQRFTMSASRGVLKDALPRWLNEPSLRPYILAISPAGRGHGREGAMYVLLKRRR